MFVNRNTQLFCIAFLSILPNVLFGELLSHISFEKPFDTISADGVRLIGTNWDFGGSTTVNRHFVRLTPDRQSKKGFIWSNKAIEKKEWSLVFTFRISGQAENWFGDGLALWITSSTSHQEGDNHGFIGNFKGKKFSM
jgi:mannose-binding lectin 2